MVSKKEYSIKFIEKLKEKLLVGFVFSAGAFVALALLTQLTFITLNVMGKDDLISKAGNVFMR